MAYLTIKIDSDDDAFATRESACEEMRRILELIVSEIEHEPGHPLYDINGNKCGSIDTDFGDDDDDEESEDGEG
jgi:hypothetical protein